MQFIDLALQQKSIREKIEKNICEVLNHGKYIMGPEVGRLEQKLAEFSGVRHAIACSSGTDALLLSLMAKNVGPGQAIFTTPFSFIATAEVINLLGATPIFVDIDPNTYNFDPEQLERAITDFKKDSTQYPMPEIKKTQSVRPTGIIAVDLFGLPADYNKINAIAKKHDLFVIEDAAQSFGADYYKKKACSLSEIGCTSFFPAKPLGCYGDGGMIFTDDDNLANVIRSLLIHGKGTHKYDNVRTGINGRLDTIQAAILLSKFDIYEEEIEIRQQVARRYTESLKDNLEIITPHIPNEAKSVWAQYSILAADENHRAELQKTLRDAGIPTAIYYPKPLHFQTIFASNNYKDGDFPVSENCSKRIFSLPMHPYLTAEEQKHITNILLMNNI